MTFFLVLIFDHWCNTCLWASGLSLDDLEPSCIETRRWHGLLFRYRQKFKGFSYENYFSWNDDSRDICWCFPPLRRPSTAECRVAGPRVVAGLRGTWKPTRRWLGFEHSKQDHGKGKIIYEGIMKRKGVDARAGSRSDSMPESVTPDDHWSLFWTVLLFSKLTREEQTSNFFGKNIYWIYFNCWNALGCHDLPSSAARSNLVTVGGVFWKGSLNGSWCLWRSRPRGVEGTTMAADVEHVSSGPCAFWREMFGGGTGPMLRVCDLFVKNRRMEKDDEVGEARNSKCITEEDHRGPRSIIRMQSQLGRMEKQGSRSHALHVSGKASL